ncbi:MAG: HTH domain-containing protein, partial [Clostridiales bacterium]|nr:HTH domain-containing protein [Clostridiales bacterium]
MNDLTELERIRIDTGLLLDFYGQLLSDRARDILERYYLDDYSLAEIAEQLGISRQAVHDRLHQGLNNLMYYEQQLGLMARFRSQKSMIRSVIDDLDRGQTASAKSR